MNSPLEGHIYTRVFDPDDGSSLGKIAGLIRPETKVLDLGTGTGALGQYLSAERDCIVDGAEQNTEQVRQAAPFYRDLQVTDLEATELATLFTERYDYIVCADVLEHLKNPGNVLSQLSALLNPGGRILLSIPNIAHAGVIAELLAGEFRYRPEGLLDATHLRFFTRKSLLEFLKRHAFAVLSMDSVICDVRGSEFQKYYLEVLPRSIYRLLAAYPDALTYQFIVEAVPGGQVGKKQKPKKTLPDFHFACQLYWRFKKVEYNEKDSIYALGKIGADHQVIRFSIPSMAKIPAGIRLDPGDRPGFMRIYRIDLYDSEKRRIWKWRGNISHFSARKTHQMEFVSAFPAAFGINVLLTGEDPYVELPLDRNHFRSLKSGGILELKLSWPLSADFLALTRRVEHKDHELARRNQLLELKNQELQYCGQLLLEKDKVLEAGAKRLEEKERLLEIKNENIQVLNKNIQALERVTGEQRNALAVAENQWTQENESKRGLERQLAYQASWRGWVRRPFRPLKRWYLRLLDTSK